MRRASSVIPVEGIQLRVTVAILEYKLAARRCMYSSGVSHLCLPVLETVGQDYAGSMFVASGGILHRLSGILGDAVDPKRRGSALPIGREIYSLEKGWQRIRAHRTEDFKVSAAVLAAGYRYQGLALLL